MPHVRPHCARCDLVVGDFCAKCRHEWDRLRKHGEQTTIGYIDVWKSSRWPREAT